MPTVKQSKAGHKIDSHLQFVPPCSRCRRQSIAAHFLLSLSTGKQFNAARMILRGILL
jgi:hypothetical protein